MYRQRLRLKETLCIIKEEKHEMETRLYAFSPNRIALHAKWWNLTQHYYVLGMRNENIDFFQMGTEPITLTFRVRCGSLYYDAYKTFIDGIMA